MALFVVCVPASSGASSSVSPCEDVGGVFHQPAIVEMPVPGAVSYANAAENFAYAFGTVLSFWLLAIAIGVVVRLVRQGQ